MKKFIISAFAVAAMLLGNPVASAQTHAAQTDGTSAGYLGSFQWAMAVLTSRFLGSIVEKGSTVMVKYPDGTFGLSMVSEGDSGG